MNGRALQIFVLPAADGEKDFLQRLEDGVVEEDVDPRVRH